MYATLQAGLAPSAVRLFEASRNPKRPLRSFPHVCINPPRLWLQPPAPRGMPLRGAAAPPLRRVVVESSRVVKPEAKGKPGSEIWGLKLREVPDRNAAEALAQHTLLLAICDRERLRRGDEYYIQDLVGLKVRGQVTLLSPVMAAWPPATGGVSWSPAVAVRRLRTLPG